MAAGVSTVKDSKCVLAICNNTQRKDCKKQNGKLGHHFTNRLLKTGSSSSSV